MTMSKDKMHRLAVCMSAICTRPGNPVAWLELEEAGITVDSLRVSCKDPHWQGPKPDFASYPSKEFRAAYFASKKENV